MEAAEAALRRPTAPDRELMPSLLLRIRLDDAVPLLLDQLAREDDEVVRGQ